MAYTTINKSTDNFNTLTYSGSNTSTSYNNGLNMSANGGLVWIKPRNVTGNHGLWDSVRGATYYLSSNLTNAESQVSGVTSFDTTGFTLGGVPYNDTGNTFVSWSWLGGGTASSNTDGSITSTVSANTTAGFSISTYTGNGSAGATVGHGLGVTPNIVIIRRRSSSEAWAFWSSSLAGNTSYLRLNATDAVGTASDLFNSTTPSNSLVTLGTGGFSNTNTETYVMYCFAEKTGYSKFGSYVGNGNSDGTFVYTGFKPTFVLTKGNSAGENWFIHDGTRNPSNPTNLYLRPNLNNAEGSYDHLDLLSNGFKSISAGSTNGNGVHQIYMAFGQSLVGSNNVPCTAR